MFSEFVSLKSLLAAQLGICIAALKAGKQDQVLGMLSFFQSLSSGLHVRLYFFTAQSGGHEVWNAVFDLVKNVSEIMMSSLPNFWKIAKGFLDGKYRKVRRHYFSKVRSIDYLAVGI